jgi:hypothetical protein
MQISGHLPVRISQWYCIVIRGENLILGAVILAPKIKRGSKIILEGSVDPLAASVAAIGRSCWVYSPQFTIANSSPGESAEIFWALWNYH